MTVLLQPFLKVSSSTIQMFNKEGLTVIIRNYDFYQTDL